MRPAILLTHLLTALACSLLATGCALPSLNGREATTVLRETASTGLGRAISTMAAAHPGLSAVYPLADSRDAFAARALLAAAAESSIDAQYYIWKGDRSGNLLFEQLWKAAERGVRVRLLMDDNSTAGLDATLSALSAHENIQVRLFNPMTQRRVRWTNYVFDFSRANRRMHNKSFTVDNQVTVVGGRNVGDEYFDAGGPLTYRDLDVMAAGPVVNEVSDQFDVFWNSAASYPAESVLGDSSQSSVEQLMKDFAATRADPASGQYLEALRQTRVIADLANGILPLEWTTVRLVYDDPAKVLDPKHQEDTLLLMRLLDVTTPPDAEFDLISPYFVPGPRGGEYLTGLVTKAVRVRILTNSLDPRMSFRYTPATPGIARSS